MEKEFEVDVSFTFKGKFFIKAESQEQADEYAEKHCGLVLGGDIHSSLPDEDINWDFPVHPEKTIHPKLSEEMRKLVFSYINHEVAYTYHDGWDGEPNEIDIEHIEKLIKDGFEQGELNTLENNDEHRGWWIII